MNIDKILKFFVPKDHAFFPLFDEDAKNLTNIAEDLFTMISSTDAAQQEILIKKIKGSEKKGDSITETIFLQLNKSFITPLEREDIHQLAANIDNVVDSINRVAQRIQLYKPKTLIPAYRRIAELILLASKEVAFCINCLKQAAANKDKIINSCRIITGYENEADELYHSAITVVFENEKEPVELIKNKGILETLEKSVDKIEDISDVIKTILVKMV